MRDETPNLVAEIPTLDRYATADLLMDFLRWLKKKHKGEIWTPDPWADCGMSRDEAFAAARVHEFLKDEGIDR